MEMQSIFSILAIEALEGFKLARLDYIAFFGYFALLFLIGYIAGRKAKEDTSEYFLGGRTLPWYVVGSSYIAANISSEQFIGMVGSAYVYGICVATPEWSCIIAFTFLIWIFIPFLMAAKVFTTPEFLERRFNRGIRDLFALVTIITNVVVILAGVIYGGAIAMDKLFSMTRWEALTRVSESIHLDPIWFSIVVIAIVAGGWAVWGGLKSVAWMDVLTIIIMVIGGLTVTLFGWQQLSKKYQTPPSSSVAKGFEIMIEKNRAKEGPWAEGVQKHIPDMMFNTTPETTYNRLSVVQPIEHKFFPWLHWVFSFFYIGLWYLVINQFMVQRIFAAKNMYHARMGIILASFLKLLLPFFVVVPGLILFAYNPDIINLDKWSDVQPQADRGYVAMLQAFVPVGIRGLFLAALFGAIQSTVSAVVNSTSTIFTMDIFKRMIDPKSSEKSLVRVGRWSATATLIVAMGLAYVIFLIKGSLFYYIQMFYSFFAPPFSAIFLLGSLWRRINGKGALTAVILGFAFAIGLKLYAEILPKPLGYSPWEYATTFPIQALSTWAFCMIVCVVVSLMTAPPRPEQVTEDLTFDLRKMNFKGELGTHWYSNVTFWWILSMILMFTLIYIFGVKL